MQRYIITQKDAANELGIIAGWLNGYVERQQHAHRLVVNYTKLGVVLTTFHGFLYALSKQLLSLLGSRWVYRIYDGTAPTFN